MRSSIRLGVPTQPRKGSESFPLITNSLNPLGQRTNQQKILELQQKHKEMRRVRRESKDHEEVERDHEAFNAAVDYLFEKEQLISCYYNQIESQKVLFLAFFASTFKTF